MVLQEAHPGLIAGRFALHEEFASGGMAAIHFGRQIGAAGFARTVAVKRLHSHLARDPEFVAMFVDEAMLAARIRHPNVVATLDVVQHEGELLLVMEYVDGESLSGLIRATRQHGERLPADVAVRVIADVLRGLHAAHEATSDNGAPLHIVHRDVSPSNVVVGTDGVARLLDFGVAKAAVRVSSTQGGGLKGKLRYMAPEQIADQEITRRTDLYAAAVVLWELLVGEPLFTGSNEAAVMARIMQGVVVPPSRRNPSVPAALDEVVMRGLARDPAARFATACEAGLALEAALPPATAHRTADWVARMAVDALAARRAILARVEGGLWVQSSSDAAASHRSAGAAVGGGSVTEGPTLLVAAKHAPPEARSRVPWLAAAAVLVLGTLGLALGLSVNGHVSPAGSASEVPVAASGSVAADAPGETATGAEPSSTTAASSAASEAAGAGGAEPPVASSPRTSTAAPSSRRGPRSVPSSQPTTKPNCDVPYVIDASGRRQVKRECL